MNIQHIPTLSQKQTARTHIPHTYNKQQKRIYSKYIGCESRLCVLNSRTLQTIANEQQWFPKAAFCG